MLTTWWLQNFNYSMGRSASVILKHEKWLNQIFLVLPIFFGFGVLGHKKEHIGRSRVRA